MAERSRLVTFCHSSCLKSIRHSINVKVSRQQLQPFGDECQLASRFKLNVQNVHQLQQHTIKVVESCDSHVDVPLPRLDVGETDERQTAMVTEIGGADTAAAVEQRRRTDKRAACTVDCESSCHVSSR